MMTEQPLGPEKMARSGYSGKQVFVFILVTFLITLVVALVVVKYYFFATEFKPVVLNDREEKILDDKLSRLEQGPAQQQFDDKGMLIPEPYSELGADRSVSLTERELNALLAKNTNLARKLAIDMSDDLMSARAIIPVDKDFPVLGGQTIRVNAGVAINMLPERPSIVLKGVSIMGVPLPTTWLGGLKNVDLVNEFGTNKGFWQAFAAGVEDIHVEEGKLIIKLKE